jgi:SAM-dependent methyltransferase
MPAILRRSRPPRSEAERSFRQALRRQGYALPPKRRPLANWKAWRNRPLQTSAEVDQAVAEITACGLPGHPNREKNWDLLIALGTILERTNERSAVLEMGAASYSKLLRWLYAYDYRRLVGIDLVPVETRRTDQIGQLTMDLTATTFPDESFDAIACLSVIEHGVDPEAFAREASRLLRPGGVVVLSTDFWCSAIDTAGKEAYGVPVLVLTPDDIGAWIAAAERHRLRPVEPVTLGCADKVVHWERVELDFTFINLVLVKDGNGRRLPWARSRYQPATSVTPAGG